MNKPPFGFRLRRTDAGPSLRANPEPRVYAGSKLSALRADSALSERAALVNIAG